ncbi:MAG: ATP-dependent DNA helicase [Candidatus Bathyarchaeia archaeon]
MELIYICRRCRTAYSPEDYLKSHFCPNCGTLLIRGYGYKIPNEEHQIEGLIKEFFPYPNFRPSQIEAIKFAYHIFSNAKIGLLSSPCGTGKSISALTAYFAAKKQNPNIGRLLILTRTKNQLDIYSRELKNIKEKCGADFTVSIFKSKREMCPKVTENAKLKEVSYRDFLQYCKGLKEGVFGASCEYFERTYNGRDLSWTAKKVITQIRRLGPLLPDETYNICYDEGLCPYEVTKALTRHADIIIGNYNYVLVDAIRGSILGKAGIRLREVNCVFDEAHSLPYYAADLLSNELSTRSVRRACKEAEKFNVENIDFLQALYEVMINLGKKTYRMYGLDTEHVIETTELLEAIAHKLNISQKDVVKIAEELAYAGEVIRQKRVEDGRPPVSYVARCADFIIMWVETTGSAYAKYVKVEEDMHKRKQVKLGVKCLDPALTAGVINELRSAILMSGTLWNRQYYIDILGLDKNRCLELELPNPFPPENRLLLVDKAVTTKYEKRSEIQWKRIADHLQKILRNIKGKVAIFFPSYDIMRKISEMIGDDPSKIIETNRTKISDVIKFLIENERCAILGVARGKISEGVDMTMDGRSLLSAVIIVGLPFPKKTELHEAFYRYLREKFGSKALDYANNIPCLNALAQSAGRLIRSPDDRGIIIIMDSRAAGGFKRRLPEDWRVNMKAHYKIEKILQQIEEFMQRHAA